MLCSTTSFAVALAVAVSGAAPDAAGPAYYVRQATWYETLRAPREALTKYEADQWAARGE